MFQSCSKLFCELNDDNTTYTYNQYELYDVVTWLIDNTHTNIAMITAGFGENDVRRFTANRTSTVNITGDKSDTESIQNINRVAKNEYWLKFNKYKFIYDDNVYYIGGAYAHKEQGPYT